MLSAGATPDTPLDTWTFALEAEDGTKIGSWGWEEFRALGPTEVTVDIHCVTRWSKFDTDWRGIAVDRIYHEELTDSARRDPGVTLRLTLTRDGAPGWSGAVGRIDLPAVQALLRDLGGAADSFVCGSDRFVEAASALLVQAGQPGHAIRTERFGPTGT